jgi:hypothetical protein
MSWDQHRSHLDKTKIEDNLPQEVLGPKYKFNLKY